MKILSIDPKDNMNAKAHRREKNFQSSYLVIAYHKGELKQVLELRTYGTNKMNYACLWICNNKKFGYMSGSGSAGGYGYHRTSCATMEAINKCGIRLDKNINGVGETAMETALITISKKLGYRKIKLFKTHG